MNLSADGVCSDCEYQSKRCAMYDMMFMVRVRVVYHNYGEGEGG